MKLIDRKDELNFLNKAYNSKKKELIILYGRRRIGKTSIIKEFIKDKNAIYFLARNESQYDLMRRINNHLLKHFNDLNLIDNAITNWDNFFKYLNNNVKKKFVFIFDEFPFLLNKNKTILSIFQDYWDNYFTNNNLKFILCGSSIDLMERYLLDYKSPLYGRRTGQWEVKKLNVKYIKDFLKYDIKDLFYVYSILDTIPGYLIKFSKEKKIWENVEEKILTKGEYLYEEVIILLREEFRDISNYISILFAIKNGNTSFNNIFNKTKLDKSLLSRYLSILEKLNIIKKIFPIQETNKNMFKQKNGLYFLNDNFFDFWFTYIYPHQEELELNKKKQILEIIKKDKYNYFGFKFEEFIKEILNLIYPNFYRIGKWWHKDKEIDVIAYNDKEILFGECKWKDNVNGVKILKELKEKSKFVNIERKNKKYAVFAKSFSEKVEGCYDLKDISKFV